MEGFLANATMFATTVFHDYNQVGMKLSLWIVEMGNGLHCLSHI